MELQLTFSDGVLSGDGRDDVGPFLVKGRYDPAAKAFGEHGIYGFGTMAAFTFGPGGLVRRRPGKNRRKARRRATILRMQWPIPQLYKRRRDFSRVPVAFKRRTIKFSLWAAIFQ